jgi:organic hydroperoxide reductase OsmC/OhrA
MSHEYRAALQWQRQAGETFTDNRYSRRHVLRFDGGAELAGSSSPQVVRLPWSDPAAVDPEDRAHEACFIANSVRSEVRCAPRAWRD